MNDKKSFTLFYKNIDIFLAYATFSLYIIVNPLQQLITWITNYNIRLVSLIGILLLLIYIIKGIINLKKVVLQFNSLYLIYLVLIIILIIYFASYRLVSSYPYITILDDTMYLINPRDYYLSFLRNNIIPSILLCISGSHFVCNGNLGYKESTKKVMVFLYIIFIFLLTVAKFNANEIMIGQSIFSKNKIGGSYLLIGDTLSILTILIYSMIKKKLNRFLILILSTYWLFWVGSRTSFYFYGIIMIIFILNDMKNIGAKSKLGIVINCTFIIIIFTMLFLNYKKTTFTDTNRMLIGIKDLSIDLSYKERKLQFNDGIDDIKKYWFNGRLFREIERKGTPGYYIHNILAYWVEYGIIPFFLLLYLCILLLFKVTKTYLQNKNNPVIAFGFGVSLLTIGSLLISRSYNYPYVWFALSLGAKINKQIKMIKY